MAGNWFADLIGERAFPDNTHQAVVNWNGAMGEGIYAREEMRKSLKEHGKTVDTMHMIIDPVTINTGKIDDISIPQTKRFEFRPTKWEEFVGQDEAKQRVKIIEKQFKRGMRCHCFLSALKGMGKTSFVELLSKTLNTHLIQRIGNTVTIDTLPEILNEINKSQQPCLFFIDEIDGTEKEVIKVLNSVVESYQISGKKIKPFVFCGATINKFILYKNNEDFLDRIQNHINFKRYSLEELTQIIAQYSEQLYKEDKVSHDTLEILSKNGKMNPRTTINLLETFIVNPNIESTLKICGIVKDGLTFQDVKILQFLNESPKPVGVNALAMKMGMAVSQYVAEFEPYLYEYGFLNRMPSRIITTKGKEFLNSIK